VLSGAAAIAPWIAAARALMHDVFARPGLETTPELLGWYLSRFAGAPPEPLAAVATRGNTLVAFAGAAPRQLSCNGRLASGYLVSFVCVAASEQGQGVGSALYDALLQDIHARGKCVLTFAIDGSAGARAIERSYPRNGFVGQSLGTLPAFGVFRGRAKLPDNSSASAPAPFLALAGGAEALQHLDTDPRGGRRVAGGALAIPAWRLTTGDREPMIVLQELPDTLNGKLLYDAITEAFDAFPAHGKLLVIPNLPEWCRAAAESVGLRRLPGAEYRAWLWAPDHADPWLAAVATTHPII